jgi:ABC-2 type transport system ATP-binding protein
MSAVLTFHDVRMRFGDRCAVDGVSFEVNRGEVVGLLGPNGSGKSTTIAAAAGVLEPCSGSVRIAGRSRRDDPAAYALCVGLLPQECALYDELTAAENLMFFGKLYGLSGKELRRRTVRALARFGLGDRAGHRVGTLSCGLKQRVNLAVALLHDPPLLLLDEPTAALDAASRDRLFIDLGRLRDDGHAILLSTHHWDEAELGCDRVAILERGKLAAIGEPRQLRRRPSDRAILYGHLRARPPRFQVQSLRDRLGSSAEMEVTGRRLRLAATSSEALGRALAQVLSEGFALESYHTPPAAIERALDRAAHPSTAEAA